MWYYYKDIYVPVYVPEYHDSLLFAVVPKIFQWQHRL